MNRKLMERRSKLAKRLRERPFHPPFKQEEPWRRHHGQRNWQDPYLDASIIDDLLRITDSLKNRMHHAMNEMVALLEEKKKVETKTIEELSTLISVDSRLYGNIKATLDVSGDPVMILVYPDGRTVVHKVDLLERSHDDQGRSSSTAQQCRDGKEV